MIFRSCFNSFVNKSVRMQATSHSDEISSSVHSRTQKLQNNRGLGLTLAKKPRSTRSLTTEI